jgi:4-hydroxy-tetrahydrodipicolinate reductase
VRICVFGATGKVGTALVPALLQAGHDVVDGRQHGPGGCDVAVDFTTPSAVDANVDACLAADVPVVIGTTGFDADALAGRADAAGVPCFHAANFAPGAVLMMRFAEEASRVLPRAAIVELHHETKRDAPSGTAAATAARMEGDVPIHSLRLPGLLAHQEVILGGPGETLTIRHDTTSREAFVPGVLRAVEAVRGLPAGLTVGLDALL